MVFILLIFLYSCTLDSSKNIVQKAIEKKDQIISEKKARNSGFQNTFSAEGNVNNLKEMQLAITNINSLNQEKKNSIDNLEKEMIYLGNSKKRVKEIINQIIENKYETV